MLGLERTRAITITAATAAYSRAALRTAELRRCWQHTIATAVLSEEVSRSCRAFTESAYSAGIMHDVGRLGLLVAYPSEYEKTIRDCAQRCLDLLDFERETFGIDHTEAGRWLSERWRLPEEFRVIAGRHHDPCEGTEMSLLKIVHTGCRLADLFEYDVIRPLTSPNFEQIISGLPEYAQDNFMSRIDAVYDRLKKTVHSFDGDESSEASPNVSRLPVLMPPEEQFIEAEYEEVPEPGTADADHTRSTGLLALLLRLLGWIAQPAGRM
jgi:HD-like signal output (HDOD) protein